MPAEEDFHALIADQNRDMDTLGLQIRTLMYPVDKQKYIGFVNTVGWRSGLLGCACSKQTANSRPAGHLSAVGACLCSKLDMWID